jgi:hypothetical protein
VESFTFEARQEMDKAERARMQARIVMVVYRAEMRRLARLDISSADRLGWENALQRRSIGLLDRSRATLAPGAMAHVDAKRRLAEARAQIPDPDAP